MSLMRQRYGLVVWSRRRKGGHTEPIGARIPAELVGSRRGRLGSIGRIDPGPERLAGRVTLRAEVDGYLHCTLSTASDATAGLLPEPAPDGALCLAEGVDDVLICFGVLGDTERLSDVAP